jgi:RNA polymerase sigma-70 factor, ECF subfamily
VNAAVPPAVVALNGYRYIPLATLPPVRSVPFNQLATFRTFVHLSTGPENVATPETDEQLLLRLQSGEAGAFEILYHRYGRPIYGFCLRMLRNESQAEDAAAETFLKMYNSIDTLTTPGAFRPWLFRIARNEALMMLRQRKSTVEANDSTVWTDETPLTLLTDRETAAIVHDLVHKLKVEFREVLIMREEYQLTYAEIAASTGLSESAVKSRIFKARKALIDRLRLIFQERRMK